MDLARAIYRGSRALVRLQRRRRGPLRPTWDEKLETTAMLYRVGGRVLGALPAATHGRGDVLNARLAGVIARGSRSPEPERVDAMGVPGAWFPHARFPQEDGSKTGVLYYLHGGGFVFGAVATHRPFITRLARASGMRAFAIDYRLAPRHPFPAALDDAVAGYRYLLEQGIEPKRIVIAGESAGGALTAATLVALRDRKLPLPAAGICLSALLDFRADAGSYRDNDRFDYVSRRAVRACVRAYTSPADRANPLAAPIHADLTGLPPLLLQAGGAETLLDDSRRFVDRARAHRVEAELAVWPDMIHAWHIVAPWTAEAREATQQAGAFARRQVDRYGAGDEAAGGGASGGGTGGLSPVEDGSLQQRNPTS